ncbi:MAG TPA: hypothetical protein VMX13_09630 [Sedimentisphaerales bacterium]|nr:hypothetical protein [Sedimentisphaerales bacterium]
MRVDDILVSWVIPTFDRQMRGPFPLPRRYYELDWTKASENEQAEIIEILAISDNSREEELVGIGAVSETFIVGAARADERMLRFRHMFVEKPIEQLKRLTNSGEKSYRVFTGVNLNREYFEDERGQEISMGEMMQIATGDKNAVPFNAEGIVKIGPTDMYSRETWTINKANTLFNFIQAVRLIWGSSWARKRSTMTIYPGSVVKCDLPTVESMCAVLTLFRQLYSKDALMRNTCEIYNEHCGNGTKKKWVDFCLQAFKERLGGNTSFIHLETCSVRELFEAFLYGTGIVHSPSDRNAENRKRLSMLVGQYGREKVIMAVNESFWMVLKYAIDVFHVVKQDYEHWTKSEGCAKSDVFDIYSLLQSHSS